MMGSAYSTSQAAMAVGPSWTRMCSQAVHSAVSRKTASSWHHHLGHHVRVWEPSVGRSQTTAMKSSTNLSKVACWSGGFSWLLLMVFT